MRWTHVVGDDDILGVGRIFLKHRAAQMLDALHYYDQAPST